MSVGVGMGVGMGMAQHRPTPQAIRGRRELADPHVPAHALFTAPTAPHPHTTAPVVTPRPPHCTSGTGPRPWPYAAGVRRPLGAGSRVPVLHLAVEVQAGAQVLPLGAGGILLVLGGVRVEAFVPLQGVSGVLVPQRRGVVCGGVLLVGV